MAIPNFFTASTFFFIFGVMRFLWFIASQWFAPASERESSVFDMFPFSLKNFFLRCGRLV